MSQRRTCSSTARASCSASSASKMTSRSRAGLFGCAAAPPRAREAGEAGEIDPAARRQEYKAAREAGDDHKRPVLQVVIVQMAVPGVPQGVHQARLVGEGGEGERVGGDAVARCQAAQEIIRIVGGGGEG